MKPRLPPGLLLFASLAIAVPAGASDRPEVTQAWARATAPGVDVGAVYLTIVGGQAPDELVSAATPRAAMVHLHTVQESEGVAKMRAVEGVAVAPGQRVVLAPKGTHVMLMGLDRPLVAGESFPLELRFANAGAVEVNVVVRPAGADAPAAPAPR